MEFGFKQPLVGEKRCVTTQITAAEETRVRILNINTDVVVVDGIAPWIHGPWVGEGRVNVYRTPCFHRSTTEKTPNSNLISIHERFIMFQW